MAYDPLAWMRERIVRPTYRRVYKPYIDPHIKQIRTTALRVRQEAKQYVPTVSYEVAAERRKRVVDIVKRKRRKPPAPVGFQEKIVSQKATALRNLESQYTKAGRIAPTGEFLPTATINVERKYARDITPTGEFKTTHTDVVINKWASSIRGQNFIGSKEQFTHYQSEFNVAQQKDKARYNAYKKDWDIAQQADKKVYGAYRSKYKEYESERIKLTKLKAEKQKELKEFVTYPIYKETAEFGKWWEEKIVPKRIRPETPTPIKPLAKFGVGLIRSPGQVVSFFGMVPSAVEYAARDADEFAVSLAPGAVVAGKGMVKHAKEEPFVFAGEMVGILGLTYGVARVARPITAKIPETRVPKISFKRKVIPRKVERPFTLRDIEMAEKQAAIVAKEAPVSGITKDMRIKVTHLKKTRKIKGIKYETYEAKLRREIAIRAKKGEELPWYMKDRYLEEFIKDQTALMEEAGWKGSFSDIDRVISIHPKLKGTVEGQRILRHEIYHVEHPSALEQHIPKFEIVKEVPVKVDVIKPPIKEPYAISKTIKEIRQAEAGIKIKPVLKEKPEWLVEEIRVARIRKPPVEEYYFPEEYIPLPEVKVPTPVRKVVVITKERVIPEIKVAKVMPEIKVMPKVKVKVDRKPKAITRVLTEADRSAAYLPKTRVMVGIAPLTKTETAILTEIREKTATAIKPMVAVETKVKVKEKKRVKVMPLVIPRAEVVTETEVVTLPKVEVIPKVITELKVKVEPLLKEVVIVGTPPIEKMLKPKIKKKKKKPLTIEEELEEIYRKRKYPTLTPEQMLKM